MFLPKLPPEIEVKLYDVEITSEAARKFTIYILYEFLHNTCNQTIEKNATNNG